jgi:hypothetical protein
MKTWKRSSGQYAAGTTLRRQSRLTIKPQLDRSIKAHHPFSAVVAELQTFGRIFILNESFMRRRIKVKRSAIVVADTY